MDAVILVAVQTSSMMAMPNRAAAARKPQAAIKRGNAPVATIP
jgi:hypothetical protein